MITRLEQHISQIHISLKKCNISNIKIKNNKKAFIYTVVHNIVQLYTIKQMMFLSENFIFRGAHFGGDDKQ